MKKAFRYLVFIVTSVVMGLLFVTAKSLAQLGAAVILYPVFVFITLDLVFPRKKKMPQVAVAVSPVASPSVEDLSAQTTSQVEVVDIDKRAFLKLIGVAGVSFFLFSLFKGRTTGLLPGGQSGSSEVTLQDTSGNKINPPERQPMDGFHITEIDDNIVAYYGFTNRDGAWIVMREDTDSSSFRYAKGESGFPDNWSNREKLTYDYFHNVF